MLAKPRRSKNDVGEIEKYNELLFASCLIWQVNDGETAKKVLTILDVPYDPIVIDTARKWIQNNWREVTGYFENPDSKNYDTPWGYIVVHINSPEQIVDTGYIRIAYDPHLNKLEVTRPGEDWQILVSDGDMSKLFPVIVPSPIEIEILKQGKPITVRMGSTTYKAFLTFINSKKRNI